MGTNFYFYNTKTQDKTHICKISCGWKVLFQANKDIGTMEDLFYFYFQNKEETIIKDEYDQEYTLSEFLVRISEHNKKEGKSHIGTGCGAYEADLGTEFTEFEFS